MTTSNRFLEPRILLGICTLAIFLSGCVTTTGNSSAQKGYSVGPSYGSEPKSSVGNSPTKRTDLSILVLPLDPNIPENSDEFTKKNIWPELRRAEANHFAVKLRDALNNTNAFESARVVPDKTATGDLYLSGKIVDSNGEDIEISVSLTAINGETLLQNMLS